MYWLDIQITAHGNLTSYEWRIGADERTWNTSYMDIGFIGFDGDVDIVLTTTSENQYDCLEEAELVDV